MEGCEPPAQDFSPQSESIQREENVDSICMANDLDTEELTDSVGFDTTSGSSVYELTGWGAFDSTVCKVSVSPSGVRTQLTSSKVTSGFGNIEDVIGTDFMHF